MREVGKECRTEGRRKGGKEGRSEGYFGYVREAWGEYEVTLA